MGNAEQELDQWAAESVARIFRDGNQWCAVGHHFRNLQESHAGFGDTPLSAVYELRKIVSPE